MSPELINAVSTGGAGFAVLVMTVIFLRFIREERDQMMADHREDRRDYLARLEEVARQLGALAGIIERNAECLHTRDRRRRESGS